MWWYCCALALVDIWAPHSCLLSSYSSSLPTGRQGREQEEQESSWVELFRSAVLVASPPRPLVHPSLLTGMAEREKDAVQTLFSNSWNTDIVNTVLVTNPKLNTLWAATMKINPLTLVFQYSSTGTAAVPRPYASPGTWPLQLTKCSLAQQNKMISATINSKSPKQPLTSTRL